MATDKTNSSNSAGRNANTPSTVKMVGGGGTNLSACDTRNGTIIAWHDTPGLAKQFWDVPSEWRFGNKLVWYRHLDRVNAGLQNGDKYQNKSYETYRLNYMLMEMVADKVELTTHQQSKAISIFTSLNLSEFGRNKEDVALAVCGYVLFKDGLRKCHPNARGESRDEVYREACRMYNCTDKTVNKLFYEVQREVENGLPDKVREYGKIEPVSKVQDQFAERVAEWM
jgi:hypothetical protein